MVSVYVVYFGGSFLTLYFLYKIMSQKKLSLFKIGYQLYVRTSFGYYYYRREVRKARALYNGEAHSVCTAASYNDLYILPIAMAIDNYAYMIADKKSGHCVLVDPSDPEPVQAALTANKMTPVAVLTTHRHWDHSAGNSHWRHKYPGIPVYGSSTDDVPSTTHITTDGDVLRFGEMQFSVCSTPGHTLGHVVYVLDGSYFSAPKSIFSGDHIFIGSIGKIFEGDPTMMLKSLDVVCKLPDNSLLWPGHEYTEENLEFAAHLEPANKQVRNALDELKEKRKDRHCSCPSTIGKEKLFNPFLRTHQASLRRALNIHSGGDEDVWDDAVRSQALLECRTQKNVFKLMKQQ